MDHSAKTSIEQRVIAAASKFTTGNQKITVDTKMVSLGFDSLTNVELVMAVEHDFLISIPDTAAYKFSTIGHIVDHLVATNVNQQK